MKILVFDTETTGLPTKLKAIGEQPYITEFAGIKFEPGKKRQQKLEFLCKPPTPIPDNIVKITGIDDAMVAGEQPFKTRLAELREFFTGVDVLMAHNVDFDVTMLATELTRANSQFKFPWPITHICTAEFSRMYGGGGRLKMSELHEHLFGEAFEGAHRAMVDTAALTRCVIEMIKRKDLVL